MVVQNGLRCIRSHGFVEDFQTVPCHTRLKHESVLDLIAGTTDVSFHGCYNQGLC